MKRFIKRAPGTAVILTAIAAVYVVEAITGAADNEQMIAALGAILPWSYISAHGEYWRLFTGMFLHGGIWHWAVNSWALYQLGYLYEVMFGTSRFVIFYFATGLIASTASSLRLSETPMGVSVGASGAIFGILGAFIFSIRRSPQWRHEPWTRSLIAQLVFWAVLNIIIGFNVKMIDNTAHIAGLISGLVLGFLPHRVPPPPPGSRVIDIQPYEDGLHLPQDHP